MLKEPSEQQLCQWIRQIEDFPKTLNTLTSHLSTEQKNWCYRPEGWTIKQVVHHCADSHMNSFIRFKLALTEDTPTIKPYFENKWAELPDAIADDINDSILLLNGLHKKWVLLLRSLNKEQLKLEFINPESGKKFNLAETISLYAWHSSHHLAHINNALEAKGRYN